MESNRGKRYSPEERAEFVQLYKESGQSLLIELLKLGRSVR